MSEVVSEDQGARSVDGELERTDPIPEILIVEMCHEAEEGEALKSSSDDFEEEIEEDEHTDEVFSDIPESTEDSVDDFAKIPCSKYTAFPNKTKKETKSPHSSQSRPGGGSACCLLL